MSADTSSVRRCLALAAALLCLLPTVAEGFTPKQAKRAERAAGTIWVGHPCTGRFRAVYVQNPVWPEGVENTTGWAPLGDTINCTVFVHARRGIGPADLCTVLAHEFGHLAGLEHTDRWGALMSPDPSTPRACRRAFPKADYVVHDG